MVFQGGQINGDDRLTFIRGEESTNQCHRVPFTGITTLDGIGNVEAHAYRSRTQIEGILTRDNGETLSRIRCDGGLQFLHCLSTSEPTDVNASHTCTRPNHSSGLQNREQVGTAENDDSREHPDADTQHNRREFARFLMRATLCGRIPALLGLTHG